MIEFLLTAHTSTQAIGEFDSWESLLLSVCYSSSRFIESHSWERLNRYMDEIVILEIECEDEEGMESFLPEFLLGYNQLFCLRLNTKLSLLPEWIGNMHQLKCLDLYGNKLSVLPRCIEKLQNLTMLDIGGNQMTELPEWIGNLTNLKTLRLGDNQIHQFPQSISSLQRLTELSFSGNEFTLFPENIRGIRTLGFISCEKNRISFIPEWIHEFTRLYSFVCSENMITTLPIQFMMCRFLHELKYGDNPIEYIPAPLVRWIANLRNHRIHRDFYEDNQNVHDTTVQESMKNSIFTLLNDRNEMDEEELKKNILENEVIHISTKNALIEYMENKETHSILNITFCDLLKKVIPRIESHPTSKLELYQRLNEEMDDAECMCFTGRLTRLVNVLVGFYDDMKIEISANTQISVIISLVKKRHHLSDEDDLTEEAKNEIRQELQVRGYENELIETWLSV